MQDESSIRSPSAAAERLTTLWQHIDDWRQLDRIRDEACRVREAELDRQDAQDRQMRQSERQEAQQEWRRMRQDVRQEARRVRQEARHVRREVRRLRKEVRHLKRFVRAMYADADERRSKRLREQARTCIPLIVARDGYRCRYCGSMTATFVVDHIHPISRGGGNVLENLALACEPCNLSKGAKTLDEWHGPVRSPAPPYFN